MASPKLNPEEKKDLDKFTKFLALKAAQIIVQSRLGEKVKTQCKPHSTGSDWFNLAIRDLPDVLTEAKKALCSEGATTRLTLCVDISLRTVEGDTMMLETWNLGVLPDECDSNVRVTYTVYNRMGLLLKSLVTVTRVTPAYKLSRRQSPDSYVICYRIYMGEPQLQHLGEGYKQVKVGQLCTPIGTIQLSVSYRTKMTISPQATERDAAIMLKSDHFAPKSNTQINDELNTSMSDISKIGAFADQLEKTDDIDERLIVPDTPFSSLLAPRPSPPLPPSKTLISEEVKNSGSEAEREADGNGNLPPRPSSRAGSRADSRRSSCSFTSANDDFFMVDLVNIYLKDINNTDEFNKLRLAFTLQKTPFANNNSSSDLGTFYKECQQAPPLQEFEDPQAESVSELAKQLEDFELSAPKYDQLLSTLCCDN